MAAKGGLHCVSKLSGKQDTGIHSVKIKTNTKDNAHSSHKPAVKISQCKASAGMKASSDS